MDVIGYLESKNINYKRSGVEVYITCPYCNKEKLYINTNTLLFNCKVCSAESTTNSPYAKGHVSKLKELFGDVIPIVHPKITDTPKAEPDFTELVEEAHQNLFKHKQFFRYILQRGLTEETVKKFKLGGVNKFGQDWLVIPSFEKGIPKLIKYRKIPPDTNTTLDKYIREKGGKSILFNGDCIEKFDEIIIAEGEIEAVTLIQNGHENVVGITAGAGSLLPEWYDQLIMKEKIYLVLDNDAPGQMAARDVWATRLGVSKCWNILLPQKDGEKFDINDFFKVHTNDDFEALKNKAEQFKVSGIVSLSEALIEFYQQSQKEDNRGYPLPWERLNRLIGGGLVRKRLYTLSGTPGVGKTTFAVQILYCLAKTYGLPGLMFCLEMPEVSLATKIIQQVFGLSYEEVRGEDALIYETEIGNTPIYFGYKANLTPDQFKHTMTECRNRYGVEFGIFDNIQRMIRSDKLSDTAKASGMFKDLTMELNIPFMLLSQPRKKQTINAGIFQDDLRGAGELIDDADTIIMLYRKRERGSTTENSLSPLCQVLVEKGRFSSGGITYLYYDGPRATFLDIDYEKVKEMKGEK